jgi:hypothetical protein
MLDYRDVLIGGEVDKWVIGEIKNIKTDFVFNPPHSPSSKGGSYFMLTFFLKDKNNICYSLFALVFVFV